ncbi:MAG TPA: glycosyltransferase [Acidimicrobiales bacterium]|nr:glycosyltransferase [Acidimicrobiales bacterium]
MVATTPGADGGSTDAERHARERRPRALVITDDVLTGQMAGPAIRSWHVAEALTSVADVVLATTSGSCEVPATSFVAEAAEEQRFEELERWCDVLVMQGYVLHKVPALRRSDKRIVFDVYDPVHLEALELTRNIPEPERSFHVRNSVRTLEEQLVRGDFFVCASDKQRDFWLGFLASVGRVNPRTYEDDPTLRRLIDVVPFGLPDAPPVHTRPALRGVVEGIGPDDDVVLWGGGVYDWFDPQTLIRAVATLRSRRPRVRLFFMGMRHPKPDVATSPVALAARRLADDLGLTGTHVFFNEGWVPYDERQNVLLEADVGVSLHHDTVETTVSFRTRMLDYLWAGLPVVASAGDSFAELIAAEDIGTVVAPGDVDDVARAIGALLDDGERRRRCGQRAQAVAARFRWSVAAAPLVAYCAAPRRAADAPQWAAPPSPPSPSSPRGGGGVPGGVPLGPAPVGLRAVVQDLRRARRMYAQGGARAVAADARRWVRDRLARR